MASTYTIKMHIFILSIALILWNSQAYVYYGDIPLSWQDGNAFCMFSYGTTLASIHNFDQHMAAALECKHTNPVYDGVCWIGAIRNHSAWIWSDGTPFDYGATEGVEQWEPDNDNEDCAEMKLSTVHWNDNNCSNHNDILCNDPSRSYTVHNTSKIIPTPGYHIGDMDILDEVHIEFDFIVYSKPNQSFSNILHIGSDPFTKLPAIYLKYRPYNSPILYLHITFSRINDTKNNFHYFPIILYQWYHFEFHTTQTTTLALINGSEIYNNNTQNSHAILMQQAIYISNPNTNNWPWPQPMNGSLNNLKITTHNAYTEPFNYLCDFYHRFTVIKGNWFIDTNNCWLTQDNETSEGSVAWLGDKDRTSLNWSDFSVEFVVNIANYINATRAQAGLLFHALSVSPANGSGRYYSVNIDKHNGIQFDVIKDGFSHKRMYFNNTAPEYWMNKDIRLRVEAIADQFTVYLENERIFNISRNMSSRGSIGFRTDNSKATFKLLRIMFPNHNYNDDLTFHPTVSPTKNPTFSPSKDAESTANPTYEPTYEPSYEPTMSPTSIPTMNPTSIPTYGAVYINTTVMMISSKSTESNRAMITIMVISVPVILTVCVIAAIIVYMRNKRQNIKRLQEANDDNNMIHDDAIQAQTTINTVNTEKGTQSQSKPAAFIVNEVLDEIEGDDHKSMDKNETVTRGIQADEFIVSGSSEEGEMDHDTIQ